MRGGRAWRRVAPWLLAAWLWLALAPARAALPLSPGAADVDAWPAVTVLSDPEGRLDALGALRREADFRPTQGAHANLGVRRDVVWMRLPLQVAADDDGRWVLDIDYPALDRVDVWRVSAGRLEPLATLGDLQPRDLRPMDTRSLAVPLVLLPGQAHTLLLRVQTRTSMIVPLRLVKAGAFHASESRVQMLQGLATGVGLCLLAYALAQWLASREPMFLYYGASNLFLLMLFLGLHGQGALYVWPDNPWLVDNSTPLAGLLALASGLLLVERLLDLRGLNRHLGGGIQAFAWLAAAAAGAFAVGLLDYEGARTAGRLLGPAPMVLAVPGAWMRWRQGDRAAGYVFAGWVVYAAGVAVQSALWSGKLDAGTWTQHAFQAASLFEMLMWLRVLALRQAEARQAAELADRERRAMQVLAHTDALTGLPNRRGLQIEMQAALKAASAEHQLGLYVGDLDGFKAVNDRLGHDAGDELLKAVAQRLKRVLRQRDVVARLGGDEFVILARDLPGEAVAAQVGRKLVAAFAEPFLIGGERCKVGLTVGFAVAPLDGTDEAALFKRADAAMYSGKQAGKGAAVRAAPQPAY